MGIVLLKWTIIQLQFCQIGKNSQMPASHNGHARPTLNNKPKLKDLITIESTDGLTSINIIEEVARSCRKLGYMLELSENSVKNIWYSGELTDQCEKTIEKMAGRTRKHSSYMEDINSSIRKDLDDGTITPTSKCAAS